MSHNLSDETSKKIIALCKQISIAHNLDEEIHNELCSHMEDKLIAYLDGDEKLTEDDAFILVKEHFGDPAIIKELYQDVEDVDAHVSFMRNIGALITLSLGVGIIFTPLSFVPFLLFKWLWRGDSSINAPLIASAKLFTMVPEILIGASSYLLVWHILMKWRKRIKSGHQLWYFTIKPIKFFLITLSLFILSHFISSLESYIRDHFGMILANYTGNITDTNTVQLFFLFIELFSSLIVIFSCIIWLWWCDRPPRRLLSILSGFFSWWLLGLLGYGLSTFFISTIFKVSPIHIHPLDLQTFFVTGKFTFIIGIIAFVIYVYDRRHQIWQYQSRKPEVVIE